MPIVDPDQADTTHPDESLYANAVSSHWLTDGGVLLNKPLAPALRAIFERASDEDVRRLMLYVAPTGEVEVTQLPVDKADPPRLATAMNRVLGAITSQTISAELEGSEAAQRVRRANPWHASLAGTDGHRPGKQRARRPGADRHLSEAARTGRRRGSGREATRRLAQTEKDRPTIWATGSDSLLIDCAAKELMATVPEQIPSPAPVALGFRLDPDPEQGRMVNGARTSMHDCRGKASRVLSVTEFVGTQFRSQPPSFDGDITGEDLAGWIGTLARGWADDGPGETTLSTQWTRIARALQTAAPTLRRLGQDVREDPKHDPHPLLPLPADLLAQQDDDRSSLRDLTAYLLPDGSGVEQVCSRLLSLHVAERGLLAEPPSVDQRVDLVQVSADTRSLLTLRRDLAGKKLTGIQVHNFGAFYKRSWRANDWMWGRVDGAGWLIHALLDPGRLRLLMDADPAGRQGFATKVADTFKRLGWVCVTASDQGPPVRGPDVTGPDDQAATLLLKDVEPLHDSLDKELAFLGPGLEAGPDRPGQSQKSRCGGVAAGQHAHHGAGPGSRHTVDHRG